MLLHLAGERKYSSTAYFNWMTVKVNINRVYMGQANKAVCVQISTQAY